jgi:hypothetical protein
MFEPYTEMLRAMQNYDQVMGDIQGQQTMALNALKATVYDSDTDTFADAAEVLLSDETKAAIRDKAVAMKQVMQISPVVEIKPAEKIG